MKYCKGPPLGHVLFNIFTSYLEVEKEVMECILTEFAVDWGQLRKEKQLIGWDCYPERPRQAGEMTLWKLHAIHKGTISQSGELIDLFCLERGKKKKKNTKQFK